jgi:peptidyl-prolyl cis-trans isomerase SurA
MTFKKFLNTFLLSMFFALVANTASAQNVQKIVAIVNEEVISGYDVIQRIAIRILLGGYTDTPQTRKQLVPSTINNLIDDRIKSQEAARYNLNATDEEINNSIKRIEKQLRIQPGRAEQFMASKGVGFDALLDQIRVAISWNKVIGRRIVPRVNVSETEVKAEQDKMRANKGKTEYHIREIFIPIDVPTDETKISNLMENISQQLKKGGNFARAAKQFSQGSSAAKGGIIGWFIAEDLEPEIAKAVTTLKKGEISAPVRTEEGYFIVSSINQREILGDKAEDSRMILAQLVLPIAPTKKTGFLDSQVQLAKTLSSFVDNCKYLPALYNEISNNQTGRMGAVILSKLPEKIQKVIGDLKSGEASAPYLDKDVYRVFVVCDRKDANSQADTEQAIRQMLGTKRIEARAARYLADLRREAVVESR